jgi:hypothetical protein
LIRIVLQAPYLFDETIGYWTGAVDGRVLARALAEVPQHPDVSRTVEGGSVTLEGPEPEVLDEARALREAGLV